MLRDFSANMKRTGGRLFGLSAAVLAVAASVALAPTPARASEHALLGIPILSPAKLVLKKLGNPTQVLTGAQATSGGAGYGGAAGYGPPMGVPGGAFRGRGMGGGVGPLPPMGGAPGTMPGEFGAGTAAAGGAIPGYGAPGPGFMPPGVMPGGGPMGMRGAAAYGSPMAANAAGTGGQSQVFQSQEVHYIYDRPNGLTYDFLISPTGKVIQIAASGYKGAARTARGIGLGSTYGQVLAKYGFPETQRVNGGVVFLSYANRDRVAFQLMDNKVVGVIVAYVK